MPSQEEIGVVYLAFGRAYLSMALHSLYTMRLANPSMPACIITNVRQQPPELEWWKTGLDSWHYLSMDTASNRDIKTSLLDYTPFVKTIYLDCDTVVLRDLSEVGRFLDYFDVCLRPTSPRDPKGKGRHLVLSGAVHVSELPHWNSGVVFFRNNESVKEFFAIWARRFKELVDAEGDQTSLVDAVFSSECRLLSIDRRWNSSLGGASAPEHVHESIRIVHYTSLVPPSLQRALLEIDAALEQQGYEATGCTMKSVLDDAKAWRLQKDGRAGYYRRRFRWLKNSARQIIAPRDYRN